LKELGWASSISRNEAVGLDFARDRAAAHPAIPPPTTITVQKMGDSSETLMIEVIRTVEDKFFRCIVSM